MQTFKPFHVVSKILNQNQAFNQFKILAWKNVLIAIRNPLGPLIEILLSILFISFILILRTYVEILYFPPTSNPTYDIIDYFHKTASQDLILFYPNTPLIQNIVNRAFRVIISQKFWLNLSSKFQKIQ